MKIKNSVISFIIIFKCIFLLLFLLKINGKLGEKNSLGAVDLSTDPNLVGDPNAGGKADAPVLGTKFIQSNPETGDYLKYLMELPKIDEKNLSEPELKRYLTLANRAKLETDARLELVKEKSKTLIKLEKEIENKIVKLDEERQFFAKTIQQEKELKEDRLKSLLDLYGKMDPKKVALIFETMDQDLVVALFKGLPPKQVTNILMNMQPAKSVAITEYYSRIKSGNEYDILKEMNASLRDAFTECKMANMPKP